MLNIYIILLIVPVGEGKGTVRSDSVKDIFRWFLKLFFTTV
jgi:hypothetical protein